MSYKCKQCGLTFNSAKQAACSRCDGKKDPLKTVAERIVGRQSAPVDQSTLGDRFTGSDEPPS